jgi:hypothetical protein
LPSNILAALLAWLLALVIFLGFIVLLRYIDHRERMAMIQLGIDPNRNRRGTGVLRAGLITTMVGMALTVGLYPIGYMVPLAYTGPAQIGPWILPGLIPLGVGVALIISYYLTPDVRSPRQPPEDPQPRD